MQLFRNKITRFFALIAIFAISAISSACALAGNKDPESSKNESPPAHSSQSGVDLEWDWDE